MLQNAGQRRPPPRVALCQCEGSVPESLRLELAARRVVLIEAERGAGADIVVTAGDLSRPEALEQCRQLCGRWRPARVIVLATRSSPHDRAQALDAGADVVLTPPFDVDELAARIRALDRRRGYAEQPHQVRLGGLRWDTQSGAFYLDDDLLELPPREAALAAELMRCAGQVVARQRLACAVFGLQAPSSEQALDLVAHRLRKRLAGTSLCIAAVRGTGYAFKSKAEAE